MPVTTTDSEDPSPRFWRLRRFLAVFCGWVSAGLRLSLPSTTDPMLVPASSVGDMVSVGERGKTVEDVSWKQLAEDDAVIDTGKAKC